MPSSPPALPPRSSPMPHLPSSSWRHPPPRGSPQSLPWPGRRGRAPLPWPGQRGRAPLPLAGGVELCSPYGQQGRASHGQGRAPLPLSNGVELLSPWPTGSGAALHGWQGRASHGRGRALLCHEGSRSMNLARIQGILKRLLVLCLLKC